MKFSKLFTMLFVSAIMAVFTNIYSQTSMGIEGGITLANISVSSNVTTSNRTGLTVGGFADIGVSRSIIIRPGLRYVMKGFSNVDAAGNTNTFKLNYLEIPVMLKVSFPLTEVKPYVMAGPTLGIQLSANVESTNGVQTQDADISANFETVDLGLFFGSGLDFHIANRTDMFIGGGYSLGLSNILKGQNLTVTAKNGGFQFMGGFKFNL